MNRTTLTLALTLGMLLLLVACASPEVDKRLADIEQQMQSQPDSALAHIQELSLQHRITHPRQRAWHALLHAQALDKNFIDSTNDSIINIAVEYYDKYGSSEERGTAYYYKSRICENNGWYEDALAYSVKAEEELSQTDNFNQLALTLANRADFYITQYRFNEAIDLYYKAIELYKKCNNTRNIVYAHLSLSHFYMVNDCRHVATAHIDTAHMLTDGTDKELLFLIESYRASLYEFYNEFDTALYIFTSALKNFPEHQPNIDDYFLLARYYHSIGLNDSALYYLDNYYEPLCSTHAGLTALSLLKSDIYKDMGDDDSAYEFLLKYTSDKIESGILEQNKSIPELENKYKSQILKEKNKNLQQKITSIVIFSLLLIALITLLTIFLILRSKHTKTHYEYLYASIVTEQNSMKDKYNDIHQLLENKAKEYNNELGKRIDLLQKIVNLSSIYENNKELFYKECRSYINLCSNNKDSFIKDIRYITTSLYGDVINSLTKRFPNLSNEEIDLCCLICLGFNNNHLRILFNHSHIQSIYSKRSRLRQKLGLDNNDDIKDFIINLC